MAARHLGSSTGAGARMVVGANVLSLRQLAAALRQSPTLTAHYSAGAADVVAARGFLPHREAAGLKSLKGQLYDGAT